jgi:preprotein translocase subunit YajC
MENTANVAAAAAPVVQQGSSAGLIIWCVLLFVIIYFFMIRPNKKKMQEIDAMQSALKKGDKIVVAGGIVGKITKIDAGRVWVEVANDTEMEFLRSAVLGLDIPVSKEEKAK